MDYKYFVPISMSNHWYSKSNIRCILDYFSNDNANGLFVLADDLHLWSTINTALTAGAFSSEVLKNFMKKKSDTTQFLDKTIPSDSSSNVVAWSCLYNDNQFRRFYRRFVEWVTKSDDINNFLLESAKIESKKRNGIFELQAKYFVEEAAFSAYVNANLCEVELYPGDDNAFISYIHTEASQELSVLLGIPAVTRKYLNAKQVLGNRA